MQTFILRMSLDLLSFTKQNEANEEKQCSDYCAVKVMNKTIDKTQNIREQLFSFYHFAFIQ